MSKFRNLLVRMKAKPKARLKVVDYIKGITDGDRIVLSRAITLIESSLSSDRKLADAVIEKLLPYSGKSIRVGITGVPGVGKSTFIEALGKHLTSQNKKVAVLTVDPSSQKTKGSILGDKTRMEELSKDTLAYVRPTATGNSLGGVAYRTRESMLLCEAAGYEIILVETVGVGQSETEVKNMTDFFLLLMLPGAGDELQGIKKGIMEMADGMVVTKSDGDNLVRARQAQTDYQHALHLFSLPESGMTPKVILASSLEKKGIKETWKLIEDFKTKTLANGYFINHRQQQNINWFHHELDSLIKQKIINRSKTKKAIDAMEKKIRLSKISPSQAANVILKSI
jgi:LAO/AO transport system kinase